LPWPFDNSEEVAAPDGRMGHARSRVSGGRAPGGDDPARRRSIESSLARLLEGPVAARDYERAVAACLRVAEERLPSLEHDTERQLCCEIIRQARTLRRRSSLRVRSRPEFEIELVEDAELTAKARLDGLSHAEALERALRTVSPRARELAVACLVRGEPLNEVAERLVIAPSNARRLLRRTLIRLGTCVEEVLPLFPAPGPEGVP
jgi:hypothetical protein